MKNITFIDILLYSFWLFLLSLTLVLAVEEIRGSGGSDAGRLSRNREVPDDMSALHPTHPGIRAGGTWIHAVGICKCY